LRTFDWNVLKGKNVLGCNAAFYQGVDFVPMTIFGDAAFFFQHKSGLEEYVEKGGIVFTSSSKVKNHPDWIHQVLN